MKSNLDLFWEYVEGMIQEIKRKPRYFEVYIKTNEYRTKQEIDTFKLEVTDEHLKHTSDFGKVTVLIIKSDHTYLDKFKYDECQVEDIAYMSVARNLMFRQRVSLSEFFNSEWVECDDGDEFSDW